MDNDRLAKLDLAFRAANYLGAAQIYLRANPLLRAPLAPDQIKARLLGHWGTQPGLNLIYAHVNRLIQDTGADMMLVVGVGHGAPAILASLWIEGTLSEFYPDFGRDLAGLTRFVRAFSWPGGLPSHLTALTPGAIHEGGELGYSLLHAFGSVFDNPDLITVCVVGDGEAETGAAATSWHSPKLLDPVGDGAVLPILHLNGYKLSGPSLFGRMSDSELTELFEGYGWTVRFAAGHDPGPVHRAMWDALDWGHREIRTAQARARGGDSALVRWPLIILRTPKGWTGPKELDGKKIEGTVRSHQVPIEDPRTNPEHRQALEAWLRSYRPGELFTEDGKPIADILATIPERDRRLGRNRHANGGELLRPLELPDFGRHAVAVERPGDAKTEATYVLGRWLADIFRANAEARNFRLFCPDETTSNRLHAVFEAADRVFEQPLVATDEHLGPHGRIMEILSEHCCEGWLEGYLLTGRHGIFACYEAFIASVDSMMSQYAKWQKMAKEITWRAPVASLNYLLTSHVWEQDHNGYSHQGPTFINMMLTKKTAMTRIYMPPDANCLLSVADHCLRSRNYVNLIVASKKPMPQWLDLDAARAHCAAGASVWHWAGNHDAEPDVILAGAGDVPIREAIAAGWWLKRTVPELRLRLVNVVDLMALQTKDLHPHGFDDAFFAELFTEAAPVIFAFHGYPAVIHELIYRRPDPGRFHVHGYREEGTTTTPFEMAVVNELDRYHLAIDALRRTPRLHAQADNAVALFERKLALHRAFIAENDEDMPEVQAWRFGNP